MRLRSQIYLAGPETEKNHREAQFKERNRISYSDSGDHATYNSTDYS